LIFFHSLTLFNDCLNSVTIFHSDHNLVPLIAVLLQLVTLCARLPSADLTIQWCFFAGAYTIILYIITL